MFLHQYIYFFTLRTTAITVSLSSCYNLMDLIKKHKSIIQQISGSVFLLPGIFYSLRHLRRIYKICKNYNNFLNIKSDLKIDYNKFISNPHLREIVIIPNVSCTPSKLLFQRHMKMVDNYQTEAHQTYSYPEKCSSFDAEIV